MTIKALFVCACGFTSQVEVRIDERVFVRHACRLEKAA